jgi:hypothetical protein
VAEQNGNRVVRSSGNIGRIDRREVELAITIEVSGDETLGGILSRQDCARFESAITIA